MKVINSTGWTHAAEYTAVTLMAMCWVALLALITDPMPPMWDGTWYVNMATHGVLDNDKLAAPFAYRPGMPLIARWIANIFSMPVESGFKWTGYLFAVALLVSAFALSKCFVEDFKKALIAPAIVAFSALHIKFPIFFFSLIDISVYPLMVAFFWAFIKKRYLLSFSICLVGIFFKEFMAVPMVIQVAMQAREYQLKRSSRTLAYLFGAIAAFTAAILIPRLTIPIYWTYQVLDPINNKQSLAILWLYPLDAMRDFNIVHMLMGYWLPTLLILTPARMRSVWSDLGEMRLYLGIYLVLTLLLTMYGGKSIMIYVCYTVAAQIIVIAILTKQKLYTAEIIFMLFATFLFNKLLIQIPFPSQNFAGYIDFYGGYGSRVNIHTMMRFMEMLILILSGVGLRLVLNRTYAMK